MAFSAEEMKANEDHEIPIHPELAEVFARLLRGRRKIDPQEPVLGQALGEVKKSFKSALKKAGLAPIRWHDLRHTLATWLGRSGADLAVIQQQLGHSSIAVTNKYRHVVGSEVRDALDRLPRLASAGNVVPLRRKER